MSGIRLNISVFFLMVGLSGCNLIHKQTDPIKESPIISSKPQSGSAPNFNITTPSGFTKTVEYGVLPTGGALQLHLDAPVTAMVFIRDAGFWFHLGNFPSGAYWYERTSGGDIVYHGTNLAHQEYCLYLFTPDTSTSLY